ncbi:ethanolamine utilization protein EutK [Yokenella regensburgei]|jgi:ethanolamine utilization protein EutK|uniref:Ethanolamine utilization protein EutK n=1 Tax=Yokenella regensburgei TaxID=158877 RepID=A0ABX9S0Q5_9ENTR|nr:ethanolamine utilization microcompartment protein EutK [Yokenella regensburgei]RKR63503.1 ethanolamine utilization protein EutK [Yokenella regensburgei]VFS37280.1 Ethanolamine utilization protein EutK precursor [Yokenella regensburgei]
MINALGLLEVEGTVAALAATDAMLKSANVRVLNHEVLDPGKVTLVIEGDLAACRAALDAGCVAATRAGRVISLKAIGRPEPDTEWMIDAFRGLSRSTPAKSKESEVSDESGETQALLSLLESFPQGMTAGEVAAQFNWSLEVARERLDKLYFAGTLRKRSSRYRMRKH